MAGEIVADGDRELLELAAKAAGIELDWDIPENSTTPWRMTGEGDERGPAAEWNPLTDDGDAMRLAVKLGFGMSTGGVATVVHHYGEPCRRRFEEPHCKGVDAATRRAIVRAAAEIGRAM